MPKNENLTRSKKQQSAEHTAEQYKMERTGRQAVRCRVLLFHRCLLGLQGSLRYFAQLFLASFAQDPAWLDTSLGASCGEWYRCLCALCGIEIRGWCRCWAVYRWCAADAAHSVGHVAYGERCSSRTIRCWKGVATGHRIRSRSKAI